jgi:hypothetical protein
MNGNAPERFDAEGNLTDETTKRVHPAVDAESRGPDAAHTTALAGGGFAPDGTARRIRAPCEEALGFRQRGAASYRMCS